MNNSKCGKMYQVFKMAPTPLQHKLEILRESLQQSCTNRTLLQTSSNWTSDERQSHHKLVSRFNRHSLSHCLLPAEHDLSHSSERLETRLVYTPLSVRQKILTVQEHHTAAALEKNSLPKKTSNQADSSFKTSNLCTARSWGKSIHNICHMSGNMY